MSSSPPSDEFTAEHRAIREAITRMIFAWAAIENDLAVLLGRIIRDPSNALASAIYFAPGNTETRIAIVDAVLRMAIGGLPNFTTDIEPRWKHFRRSLDRAKGVRNRVAHGQISTVATRGKNRVRLTAPLFDFGRVGSPLTKGQLPGLSSNDISQSVDALIKLTHDASRWSSIVAAIYNSDDLALRETLAQLPQPSAEADE